MKKGTKILARAAVLPVAAGLVFAVQGVASAHTLRYEFKCRGKVTSDHYVYCTPTQVSTYTSPAAAHHICFAVRGSKGNRIRFQIRRASNGAVLYTSRPLRVGDPRACTPDTYRSLKWVVYARSADGDVNEVYATRYYQH